MQQNIVQPPLYPSVRTFKRRVAGQDLELLDPQWARDLVNTAQIWSLGTHQQIQTQQTFHGPDLASATTITVSYPLHIVTGSASIQNITAIPTFAGGLVYLVNGGSWKLATGGNISTTYTPFANGIVAVVYDPVTGMWYVLNGLGVLADAQANLTGQTAAIAATTIYTPAAAGLFRVSYAAKVTTPATTSSILGGANGFQVIYTDNDDSVVVTTPAGPTSALNSTQAWVNGTVLVNAKAATALQYSFGYTSIGGTPMAYALHIRVEAL